MGPTLRKPLLTRSLLINSAFEVFTGTCRGYLNWLTNGLPFTKFQMYLSKEPNSSMTWTRKMHGCFRDEIYANLNLHYSFLGCFLQVNHSHQILPISSKENKNIPSPPEDETKRIHSYLAKSMCIFKNGSKLWLWEQWTCRFSLCDYSFLIQFWNSDWIKVQEDFPVKETCDDMSKKPLITHPHYLGPVLLKVSSKCTV